MSGAGAGCGAGRVDGRRRATRCLSGHGQFEPERGVSAAGNLGMNVATVFLHHSATGVQREGRRFVPALRGSKKLVRLSGGSVAFEIEHHKVVVLARLHIERLQVESGVRLRMELTRDLSSKMQTDMQ